MKWHLPSDQDEIRAEIESGRFQLGHQSRIDQFLSERGSPRRSAIDVGAHVGVWTRWMLMTFESVHAFEIMPQVRSCWLRNIQDPRAQLYEWGLSDQEGEVSVEWSPERSVNTWVGGEGTTVTVKPLDHTQFDSVDYIKMDVEGHELSVLRGAESTIRRHQPIIHCELKQGALSRQGLVKQDVRSWLRDRGYEQTLKFATEFVFTPR